MSTIGKGTQNRGAGKGGPCCRVEFRKGGGTSAITSASSFLEVLMEGMTSGSQPFLSYRPPSTL